MKYISIKSGIRNLIHMENIDKFIKFLQKLNITQDIINCILKYQYADGTINETGKTRLSVLQYKGQNYNQITEVNDTLNNDKIIRRAINRFIITGTQKQNHSIDVLIYGVVDDFFG